MGTTHEDIATKIPSTIRQQHPSPSADEFFIVSSESKSLKHTRSLPPNLLDSLPSSSSPSKCARLAKQIQQNLRKASQKFNGEKHTRLCKNETTTQEIFVKEVISIMVSPSLAVDQNRDIATSDTADTVPLRHNDSQVAKIPTTLIDTQTDRSKANLNSVMGLVRNGEMTSPEAMDVDSHSTTKPPSNIARSQTQERSTSSFSLHENSSITSTVTTTTDSITTQPITSTDLRAATHSIAAGQSDNINLPLTQSKKHKCPFCDVEFTRHHNLKSHLLTHSQEKPYECTTCHQRFRRLHDLKRHRKLHTGEKPHICPKCDRKFARGDALARHNKGAGGCAGRRHSLQGFASTEDDYEGGNTIETDEPTPGNTLYGSLNEPEISEEDKRRLTIANAYASATSIANHTQTFPPVGSKSELYPPNTERNPSGVTNADEVVLTNTPLYTQNTIAETPKPLTPHASGHQKSQDQSQSAANCRSSMGFALPALHNHVRSQTAKSGAMGFGALDTAGSLSRQSIGTFADGGTQFSYEQLQAFLLEVEKRVSVLENERDTQKTEISQLRNKVETLEKNKEGRDKQLSQSAAEVTGLQKSIVMKEKDHVELRGNKATNS